MIATPETVLVVFSLPTRIILQAFIWPIVIIGMLGNVGVLVRILFNKKTKNGCMKPFYRSALMSLAISDFLLLLASGTNVLAHLCQSTILWSLPDWCCSIIPYFQTVSVLVTSLTLAAVAIDRYTAFKSKYPMSTGPKWQWAFIFVITLWSLSFAISYPLLGTYKIESLVVINESSYYMGTVCVTVDRSEAAIIYTALFAMMFVPLALVFILVHVLLARNITKRNRDGSAQQTNNDPSQLSNENSTVSTSVEKSKKESSKKVAGTPSHVARKKRTVRVILVLIIIFVICRLPHWTFLLCKLYVTLSENYFWVIQIVLTLLSLFNAAIHPFLYAFLNEALSLVTWIRERCTRKKCSPAARPIPEIEIGGTISAKIPRGPYHSH